MLDRQLQQVPIINEALTMVMYVGALQWLRIGMMMFPYPESFEHAMAVIREDPGKLICLGEEGESGYSKQCNSETIGALLFLYQQAAVKRAREKLKKDNPDWWKNLTYTKKLLVIQNATIIAERRASGRWELYGITASTILSQIGEEVYLRSLLEQGERLVKRIVVKERVSPISPSPYGEAVAALKHFVSGSTMPARMYRIVPPHQSIPAGFMEI